MASFLDVINSHGKTSKSNSALMSTLCLVAACFWLVSHRQKIDCQGLSKDVHLPSLYQQLSSQQQGVLQLPVPQRGALRESAAGWGWIEKCRTQVATSLGYILSLVLTMFNFHHMAIRGCCILGGFNMQQWLFWEWSKRRNMRYFKMFPLYQDRTIFSLSYFWLLLEVMNLHQWIKR